MAKESLLKVENENEISRSVNHKFYGRYIHNKPCNFRVVLDSFPGLFVS